MENGKTSSGRRIFNFILFLCNLAMLVWIILSWREQNKPQSATDYYASLGYDVSVLENAGGASSGPGSSSGGGTSDTFGSSSGSSAGDSLSGGNPDSWFFDEEPSSDDAQTGGQTSVSYSTTARPDLTDFDGWKSHGGTVPAGAAVLTDFGAAAGSWKGYIQYDMAEELVSFTLSSSQSGADLTVDWYLIHYFGDGTWMNEEDMADIVCSGAWSDGMFAATGAISIAIRSFYEIGGQQFAAGEMTLADGSTAVIGMVRP